MLSQFRFPSLSHCSSDLSTFFCTAWSALWISFLLPLFLSSPLHVPSCLSSFSYVLDTILGTKGLSVIKENLYFHETYSSGRERGLNIMSGSDMYFISIWHVSFFRRAKNSRECHNTQRVGFLHDTYSLRSLDA